MSAYRLDPIPTGRNDPRWERSEIQELIWAGAATPEEARELVALRTMTSPQPRGYAKILLSPWYDDRLATCVLDAARADLPDGVVIKANGNPV
jgi:hypothetical protein